MPARVAKTLIYAASASLFAVGGTMSLSPGWSARGVDEPQYMSPDNPWAVGAPADDSPRWQRQAFVDHSQDGAPGPAEETFGRSAPAPASAAGGGFAYYRNCNDARAAGAAPLYRGQPGYRPQMDGDGDGIACEPYRGR